MHVAGALTLDYDTDVLVLLKGPTNQAGALLQVYRQAAGFRDTRVKAYGPTENPKCDARALYNLITANNENPRDIDWVANADSKEYKARVPGLKWDDGMFNTFVNKYLTYGAPTARLTYRTLSVVGATYLIAGHTETAQIKADKARAAIYERTVNGLAYDPILFPTSSIIQNNQFGATQLPAPGAKILLLWARYTGQNTYNGYNPEGDSDVTGQGQLLALAQRMQYQVITIGHGPAADRNEQEVRAPCHLGEFYANPMLADKGRAGQLSFFLALMERYTGKIIQMGQKTGGMDASALVGMPTLYIEDEDSPTKSRMAQWTHDVPGYKSIIVQDPPTSLGKALRALTKALDQEPNDPQTGKKKKFVEFFNENNRRMLAMLFALRSKLPEVRKAMDNVKLGAGEHTDLERLNSVVQDNSSSKQLEEWKKQIRSLTEDQLKDCGVSKGYTQRDMNIIEKALNDIVPDFENKTTIVRNRDGKYVTRAVFESSPQP